MNIKQLIKCYANLYTVFEELQKDNEILPKGDQKTGVIGEYYAKCYANTLGEKGTVKYADPGDVFDLSYQEKDSVNTIKVQVKCVSSHSKTRIMAPLNLALKEDKAPFDFLYLISLDSDFKPNGFYINTYDVIVQRILVIKKYEDITMSQIRISGLKMKGENTKGSNYLDFSNEKKIELEKAIDQFVQ